MKKLVLVAGGLLITGAVIGSVLSSKLAPNESMFASAPQAVTPQASRPATALAAGSGLPDLSAIAEDAVTASANISSTQEIRQRVDPFYQFYFGDRRSTTTREAQSLGSGVVVTPDGYILTNSHVLLGEGGDIREVKVTLPGKEEMTAKIVGVDTLTDLAVLKVDAKGLHTLPWGDSDKIHLAEWVLAIGNPFQFNQTVTLGIVSAVGRTSTQLGTYGQMIQTDAAINPGNSGGALVNSRGELVGINSMIYSRGGGSEGLGFAIPANLAQRIMKELIATGSVNWGTILDVEFVDAPVNPQVARRYGINTNSVVLVYGIATSSQAARAGLRRDDAVLGINGKSVSDANEFQRMLADAKIGSLAELEVFRNGERLKIKVPIASTKDQKPIR
jgi:S1-C subfamily serine protease